MNASPLSEKNRQLVLVRSRAWYAATGVLERYERKPGGAWTRVESEFPVNLGRRGMAWGRGVHRSQKLGPSKKEGDGKSPAGVFPLELAFGAAETMPRGAREFPYLQTSGTTYCVEDARSAFYNQIIDSKSVPKTTWEKWSGLRRADGLFDWAVVVAQNAPEAVAGAGSCVFLHIWRGPGRPTSGCTAMSRERLESVLRWLDRRSAPVLVQLPESVYTVLRSDWDLP